MSDWNLKVLKASSAGDREVWARLVEGLPLKGISFTPGYMMFYAHKMSGEPVLVTYGDEENYIVHPLVLRRINDLPFCSSEPVLYDAISPWYHGGPSARLADRSLEDKLYRNFLSEFGGYCRASGIVAEFVRLFPLMGNHLPLEGLVPIKAIGATVHVDLSQTREELWTGFERSCRKNIKRAQASGVEVRMSQDKADIGLFNRVYTDFLDRKESDPFYYFSDESLEELFDLVGDGATLFFATYQGEILAANMVVHKYDIAEDYLRGAYVDDWRIRPNNIILYHIILWARDKGYKYFNIGGGRGGQVDDQFRFKATFSRLHADFLVYSQVHNQAAYDELCNQKMEYDKQHGVAPGSPDFFPAYRSA